MVHGIQHAPIIACRTGKSRGAPPVFRKRGEMSLPVSVAERPRPPARPYAVQNAPGGAGGPSDGVLSTLRRFRQLCRGFQEASNAPCPAPRWLRERFQGPDGPARRGEAILRRASGGPGRTAGDASGPTHRVNRPSERFRGRSTPPRPFAAIPHPDSTCGRLPKARSERDPRCADPTMAAEPGEPNPATMYLSMEAYGHQGEQPGSPFAASRTDKVSMISTAPSGPVPSGGQHG